MERLIQSWQPNERDDPPDRFDATRRGYPGCRARWLVMTGSVDTVRSDERAAGVPTLARRCGCATRDPAGSTIELVSMWVAPAQRRAGIAAKLVAAAAVVGRAMSPGHRDSNIIGGVEGQA
jgi:GNAT superfamily N-acetyltransferase